MQDDPINPTSAVGVILNQVDSYNQFNQGREVYIKLKDMYIGLTPSEVITIGGKTDEDEVGEFTASQIPNQIFRSTVTEEIVPLELSISAISSDHIGMLVKVNNAEFPTSLEGEPFGDASEDFDTQREIQACEGFSYSNFLVETSSFANFYNTILPTGNGGSISGIITKSYGGDELVMVLNSLDDVEFDQERCTLWDINDFTVVFEEDFESMPTYTSIASNGWTNFAEVGGRDWRVIVTSDSGNSGSQIASFGAYNSGDAENIAWLITPSIDLDSYSNEFATFQSSNSFSDDSELELLISSDWDGTEANITSATWTSLSGTIVDDSEYYQNWVDSGTIDLSSYSGSVYIAFKYIGGDNSADTIDGNYEIDNFIVYGE
jgi:hypothetical protein